MSTHATGEELPLDPFDQVVAAFGAGKPVVLVDDADRENEGDVVVATEAVTPDTLVFLMEHARGLICISISDETARRLELPLQVTTNNSPYQTPFAVSIDALDVVPNGVTARGRARTMRKLLDPSAGPRDFVVPGHVFPLIANPAGVFARAGHTEGVFDLARITGKEPSGILCEILNQDGTMARGSSLVEFARRHGLLITSIEAIKHYRAQHETSVRVIAARDVDTDYGTWRAHVFADDAANKQHVAMVRGDLERITTQGVPLVRIHSECLTGDVFGSRRCDCGPQLDGAMRLIAADEFGVVLYLRQEGRGIGLENKVKAYALQDQGLDTVEANLELGFEADERNFSVAAHMLRALGITEIRLMTNNPVKAATMGRLGITVRERVPMIPEPDPCSRSYLATKRDKLGHLL
ncbi:MAG: hypothetical protein RL326_618, partial [Pseudomonadota bacterium]